jgi:prefoldin subunit 5
LAAHAPQPGDNNAHEALTMLQSAFEQLSTRKQSIEAELARIEGLRGEHEAVTAQVAALEQAMKSFQQPSLRQPRTA